MPHSLLQMQNVENPAFRGNIEGERMFDGCSIPAMPRIVAMLVWFSVLTTSHLTLHIGNQTAPRIL